MNTRNIATRPIVRLIVVMALCTAAACGSTSMTAGESDANGSFDASGSPDGSDLDAPDGSDVDVPQAGDGDSRATDGGGRRLPSGSRSSDRSSSGATGNGAAGSSGTSEPVRVAFSIYDASAVGQYVPSGGGSEDQYSEHLRRSREEIAALVKHTNDTGGIGGRRVDAIPMVLTVDDVLSEARMSATCAEAAEDHGANVFIDSQTVGFESTMACFAQHKTTLVGTLSVRSVDTKFLESVSPFVAGSQAAADRIARAMVAGLANANFFKNAKVGVLRIDSATHERIYKNVVLPSLKSVGVTPVETATFTADDPSAASAQASSAVLKFKAAGVTHVIALVGYFAWVGFTQNAEGQRYYPRYGVSDYVDTANQAAMYGPEAQKKDALAVVVGRRAQVLEPGQQPSADGWFLRDFDRANPQEASPGLRRCLDILSAGTGRDYYKGNQRGGTWHLYCDNYLLWLDAARRVGRTMTSSNWGGGLGQLGSDFAPAMVYSTFFAPGRYDGGASYRVGKYGPEGCHCFYALGPWQKI